MKAVMDKYRGTLASLLCVAVNVPFVVAGHIFNIFTLGWCAAFAFAYFVGERE